MNQGMISATASGVEDACFFLTCIDIRITAYKLQQESDLHQLCLVGIFLSVVAMEISPHLLRECAAGGVSLVTHVYVISCNE